MGDDSERKNLLKSPEAAAYLHLSVRTLEDYRHEGGGPSFYRAGRGRRSLVLYSMADLNAWLEQRKTRSP